MPEKREVVLDFNLSEAIKAMLQYKTNVKEAEGATTETEKAVNKLNKELDEQIKLEQEQGKQIKTLQKRLGELVTLQQKATDTKDVKKYNAEIRKTTTAIQKLQTVEKGRAATITRLRKEQKLLGKETDKVKNSVEDLVDRLKNIVAPAAVIASFINLTKSSVQLAAQQEQTNIAFETFLGSADKARALIGELNKFSKLTPFEPDQVNAAAKSLIAFGEPAENVLNTLGRVGDIAAGTGKDFNELAIIFGKARVAGTLYAEDINQLVEAGVPVIDEFAKILGVSASEVKKLASEGKIQFPVLQKAFENLTSEGGRFFNLMKAQSTSTIGLFSTLKGTVSDLGKDIGNALLPVTKSFVVALTNLTNIGRDFLGLQKRQSDSIEDQRIKLNALVLELENTNTEEGRRKEIISELEKVYPGFLSNLKEEERTNENIRKTLDQVNKSLVNKIIIQRKSEEVERSAEVVAQRRISQLKFEEKARKALGKATSDLGVTLNNEQTLLEQAISAQEQLRAKRGTFSLDLDLLSTISEIDKVIPKLRTLEKTTGEASSELADLTKERERLAQELGIALEVEVEVDAKTKGGGSGGGAGDIVDKIKEDIEAAAKNEELRLRLKAQIEIEAAGGQGTEGGLDLLEILAQQDFADQAVKLKLDNESIQQGILNIEKEFAAKRQALKDQQAAKELADQKALNEAKAQEQRAAFEEANLLALEQFKREEELAQRRLLANSLTAGTDLQAQQRAAEQFQQDSFDAELRYLDNLKILKQTTNQSTIDEAKRINEILLQMQEGRLEAEVAKEQSAAERRNQIRQALLSGASQVASAISEIVQVNLDNELAAVEGNKIKEEQIRKKFAEKQKRLQLVQAVINVAQGITSALGSAPPPANFILAALTAAAGAIQVAAIARQKFRKGGHGIGGHTGNVGVKDETNRKVVGLVHQDEWVAPEEMTKSPTERGMIDYMESVRLGKPNTDLLKEYAKKKGIIPDVVYMPLAPRPEIPVLSGRTVQDASKHHIEIKGGKVDINYEKLSDLIAQKNDSEQRSEYLFTLLREQQDSNLKLRAELMNVREEVKKLRK